MSDWPTTMPEGGKWLTTPRDKKNFPSTNQNLYCWQKYNEWVLCMKRSDNDDLKCRTARQYANSICPMENLTAWDEQRVAGNFLGVQDKGAAAPSAHGHGH